MKPAELRAPAAWGAIDLLSDLHLAEGTPRTFDALATHLRCTQADAVLVLGDLFEAWVGDDARHEGFEAQCAAMLAEASAHRFIGFMAGNRDFLVGHDLLAHCGIVALADPTVLVAFGRRLLLSHGDALCLEDTDYQAFRAQVRSLAWQQRFLAQPLAARREVARELRAQSRQRQAAQRPENWADVDGDAAAAWLREANAAELVHGHTHRPGLHALPGGGTRHVLSDWDFDHAGAPRADVLRVGPDGLSRLAPATGR